VYLKTRPVFEQGSEWELLDVNGVSLLKGTQKAENSPIEVEHLAKGIYLFKVTSGGGVWRERVVVQ